MAYRTILVELAGDSGLEPRLQAARSLAGPVRRGADRHACDAVCPSSRPLMAKPRPISAPSSSKRSARRTGRSQERVQAVFRSVCGEGPSAIWQEAEGDRGQLLAEAARTTDLLLARHAKVGGTDAPDVLDQLVTAAGVPVLALPPEASGDLGQTVLVAWNGSREATRAVHDALPFLQRSQRRDRYARSATRPRRASKLRPRCCGGMALPFTCSRVDEPDGNAGEVLLAQAAALGRGSAGHGRLRPRAAARAGVRRRHPPRAARGDPAGAVRQLTPPNFTLDLRRNPS